MITVCEDKSKACVISTFHPHETQEVNMWTFFDTNEATGH